MFNHWSEVVENEEKMSWRKGMMKLLNMLKPDPNRPHGATRFVEPGV